MTHSPKWRVAGASVKGAIHNGDCTGCQDRFEWSVISVGGNEVFVAAVADGAGSSSSGGIGAEKACVTFVEQLTNCFESGMTGVKSLSIDFGRLWLDYFQTLINTEAEESGIDLREYSTTFVAVVADKSHAAFFQIGDGGIVYNDLESENYRFGVEPEETEYVNVSSFLTDENAVEHLNFECIESSLKNVVMFSDGITGVAVDFATGVPYEPFLRPMIAPLRAETVDNGLNEKLASFLESPAISEKSDDDKTIVLAANIGI